jgi:hypothetical protein
VAEMSTEQSEEFVDPQARITELERYEAAVLALVADMDRDGGALLSDIQRGDRFALVRRFRAVVRAKLAAQAAAGMSP